MSLLSFSRIQASRLCRAASNVKLTADKYSVSRGEYEKLNETHQQSLLSFVEGKGLTGIEQLDGFNTDWMNTVRGEC